VSVAPTADVATNPEMTSTATVPACVRLVTVRVVVDGARVGSGCTRTPCDA
jgi:hypothetical protein